MKNSKDKILHIGPHFGISGDDICLTLYKRRITQKGAEQWDVVGYFNAGRYDHALQRLLDMEVGGLNTLEDIVKCCDAVKEWIQTAFKMGRISTS